MPVKPKLTRRQTERHRESIKVGNLLTLLDKNARGLLKTNDGKPYELSTGKLKSIQMLIDKAMPNLSAIENTNIEEPQDRQSLQDQYNQARANLTTDDIRLLFSGMSPQEIHQLLQAPAEEQEPCTTIQ